MFELTENQKKALGRDRNIAVTAGAGTGKTRVLVERYIDLLLGGGVDIKAVLAITFTNKAAAEMTDRVAQHLEDLLSQNPTDTLRAKIIAVRNRLSSAYISTIHSYCMRLLREFPVEAGLGPDFSLLNEMQMEILIGESIREEITKLNREEGKWLDLFRLYRTDLLEQMWRYCLQHRYDVALFRESYASRDLAAELEQDFLKQARQLYPQEQLGNIRTRIRTVLQNAPVQTEANEKTRMIVSLLQSVDDYDGADETTSWGNLCQLADAFTTNENNAYKNLSYLGGKKSWPSQVHEEILTLAGKLEALAQWPYSPPGEADQIIFNSIPLFFESFDRLLNRYKEKKDSRSAVDYEDLQLFAFELLRQNEEIRNKVTTQFRHVMVDEFQDTNALQWAIIRMLGGEQVNDKFFIVGDPKQSIYGFRNADVRVFSGVRREFVSRTGKEADITLDESFRFLKHIGSFINDIFSAVLQKQDILSWDVDYEPITVMRDPEQSGQVEIALLKKPEEKSAQPEFMCSRIMDIVTSSGCNFGDMAVLLRTRKHLTEIEEQFRKSQIPFRTVGGIGFYQRQEIYDVYHMIRFLIDPTDDLSLTGVLRSPFATLSDEAIFFIASAKREIPIWEAIQKPWEIKNLPETERDRLNRFIGMAQKWLQRRDRVSFSDLLVEVFTESAYRDVMSAQFNSERLLANLDKIILEAARYESGGFVSLSDFASSLHSLINQQISESEAQIDLEDKTTVKIMTVHQAKGLEFPVVFLPFLEQGSRFPQQNQVYFDEKYGFAFKSGAKQAGYLFDLLRSRQHQKDVAELKRIFYVGCTRAKDHLVLSAELKDSEASTDSQLHWLLLGLGAKNISDEDFLATRGIRIFNSVDITPPRHKEIFINDTKKLASLRANIDWESAIEEVPVFLRETEDRPAGEIFSATQIMTFRKDRGAYYNRYHLGFFEGDYERLLLNNEEDTALIRGKLIHRFIEQYPDFDAEKYFFEHDITDPELISELSKDLKATGRKVMASKRIKHIFESVQSKNEVSIFYKIGSDYLTGTLDRIFINSDDCWEIVDYKTNRISPDEVEQTAERYRLQMDTYALLLAKKFPGQQSYRINLYFTQPDQLFVATYSDEMIVAVEQHLSQLLEEMKLFVPYRHEKV